MKPLSPASVLHDVATAIPEACRAHIIIIGSLAAGYHFFKDDKSQSVRTKDVDCLLAPRSIAIHSAKETANALLKAGWKMRTAGSWGKSGTADTPEDQLAAVRLYPPNSEEWFLEFLIEPPCEMGTGKNWTRVELTSGHFGLPAFRFLALATHSPLAIPELGINYARPEMMALANLLEHPAISSARMSSPIDGRYIKRANKDLGRVLALAYLEGDGIEQWPETWRSALETKFPEEWKVLGRSVGTGLRALLDSSSDFEEAHHTCIYGLLSTKGLITEEQLKFTAKRLLVDAIEPLEEASQS